MIDVKKVYLYNFDGYSLYILTSYKKNGKVIYLDGGEISTREKLNSLYLKAKKAGKRIEIKTERKSKGEIIREHMKNYDEYTDYIEDYKQEQNAIRNNELILAIVEKLKEL